MEKKLIIFIDSGDTLVDEATQVLKERELVTSADLIENAKDVIEKLHSDGYIIVLVADGMWQSFQNVYKQHNMMNYFKAFIISKCVGECKPSKKMFEMAMKKLNLTQEDKNRIVMVGNNLKRDIAGANRFGITSIWMDWSPRYYHKFEEEDWKPDYHVKSLKELYDLIIALDCAFESGNNKIR